jgi:hypothetical protein
MTFLHRTRSFITNPKENTNGIHKPLPLLPGPTACAFAAVENVPIPRRRTTTPTKTLMRRVSLIFRPSPRKKGRRPPNLTLATNNGSVLNSSRSSSLTSIAESEDDIRPPSGLGSPVSISSLPPSPFTPAYDENSPFCHRGNFDGESVFQRTRAISSPNLLRSMGVKLEAKTHLRRASVVPGQGGGMDTIPLVKPTTRVVRSFNLPAEVITVIISYLPRPVATSLAPLSRSFGNAVRLGLYTTLDLQSLRPRQLEKLVAALASRPDLAELVHHFICRTWPAFSSSSLSTSPHASVDDHRNSLLMATFTLALQRMSNLISLTLPTFNPSLLAHHTAFGLKSLTFLNATMSAQETTALLAWLDGQINIYILKFPNLQDSPITPVSNLSNPSKHHYPVPPRTPVKSQSRPNSAFLSVSPGFYNTTTTSSSPSATPTPHSSYFPPLSTSPFSPQTLLPNLTTLHGTPSLVHLLSPASSLCPQRPLRSVSLTINTTLYTGLRPAALMAALQAQGVRRLGLRFVCESVDRRTVEKVLGAVGAVLGSPQTQSKGEGTEGEGEEGNVERTGVHGWRGLRVLEVEFQGESTDFSPEEVGLSFFRCSSFLVADFFRCCDRHYTKHFKRLYRDTKLYGIST